MLFEECCEVDDDLRGCDADVDDAVVHGFRGFESSERFFEVCVHRPHLQTQRCMMLSGELQVNKQDFLQVFQGSGIGNSEYINTFNYNDISSQPTTKGINCDHSFLFFHPVIVIVYNLFTFKVEKFACTNFRDRNFHEIGEKKSYREKNEKFNRENLYTRNFLPFKGICFLWAMLFKFRHACFFEIMTRGKGD